MNNLLGVLGFFALSVFLPHTLNAAPAGTRLTIALEGKWTPDQAKTAYSFEDLTTALAADDFLSTESQVILSQYKGTSNQHDHSMFIPNTGGKKCWVDRTFEALPLNRCYYFDPHSDSEFEVMFSEQHGEGTIHHSFMVVLRDNTCSVPEAYIWWTKDKTEWERSKSPEENARVPDKFLASDVHGTCYFGGSKLN